WKSIWPKLCRGGGVKEGGGVCTCRKVGRVKSGRMGKEEEKGQEKRGDLKTNGK
ncbi:hypothetical protein GBAR_LOCUS20916, partial [Geodia barretti]